MRTFLIFFIFVFIFGTLAPVDVSAQSRSWSELWSGGDDDDDNSSRSRGYSSSLQKKINELDDDEVDDMPVPILFGVTVASLWPNFGDPRDGGAREHEGLDIMAPEGAYIVSPTDAVVTRTGKGSSAGTYVYTANPGGETFRYMHLDKIADGVRSGTELKKGDLIGYVGNTGNASGGAHHLHLEIRDGREALDPYPRLTENFSARERAKALESIIKNADDEEEEAEHAVMLYRSALVSLRAQGEELPKEIAELLGAAAGTTGAYARDLTLGSQGDDVVLLQGFLIEKESGPQADALADTGATGYFGPLTQRALAEYQAKAGVSPASGYFGPLTRTKIQADQ